jgi:hypothetical protein
MFGKIDGGRSAFTDLFLECISGKSGGDEIIARHAANLTETIDPG